MLAPFTVPECREEICKRTLKSANYSVSCEMTRGTRKNVSPAALTCNHPAGSFELQRCASS
jgi:hypothetical protein